MTSFNSNRLFLWPDDPDIPYVEKKDDQSRVAVNPAWSSLLSDLFFLTRYWNSRLSRTGKAGDGNASNVVYVSTTTAHVPIIASLFPDLTFDVYGARLDVESADTRIVYHPESFTTKIASAYASVPGRGKNILIMALRPGGSGDLLASLEEQKSVVMAMKPTLTSLRFKLPFSDDPRKELEYFQGFFLKELWGSPGNTETRLILLPSEYSYSGGGVGDVVTFSSAEDSFNTTTYDFRKYEEQLAYHNEIRDTTIYANPVNEFSNFISLERGLTNNFDSRATLEILNEYLLKLGREHVLAENALKLFDYISSQLGTAGMLSRGVTEKALTAVKTVKRVYAFSEEDLGIAPFETRKTPLTAQPPRVTPSRPPGIPAAVAAGKIPPAGTTAEVPAAGIFKPLVFTAPSVVAPPTIPTVMTTMPAIAAAAAVAAAVAGTGVKIYTANELSKLKVEDLKRLAAERKIAVRRSGGAGPPLRKDYVDAISAAQAAKQP